MTKQKFEAVISDGINRHKVFLCVKIATEGNPAPEIIINPSENFKQKLAYYRKAYDESMELISAKQNGKSVKIVDVIMTNNLNDLHAFIV